ncbi:Sucrose transport protein SUC3 [Hibiscus syriacus]|uniref:Sucrose transport protein SUC3 n=1 Tax=Hibiscus syriacus TaxID=106335 RepID=A0A6A3C8G5_HIBSY|nr:Sucrose transport protein SUC3 [Hibiscus syriacus]
MDFAVQPCVGVWSDKCTSKYGRRRPFILAGSLMISVAVIVIGVSADVGYILGDTTDHCCTFKGTRTRAAFVFVIGFWMLDLANNTVQVLINTILLMLYFVYGWLLETSWDFQLVLVGVGIDDFLSCKVELAMKPVPIFKQHFLSLLQNGFEHSKLKPDVSAVANSNRNSAENVYERVSNSRYANSKDTDVQNEVFSDGPGAVSVNLLTSLRHLPPGMHSVLVVKALSWVVLGVSSFFIKPMCQRMGSRLVWAMSNYTVFACMALTAIISLVSVKECSQGIEHAFGGSAAIRSAVLVVFNLLGFPLAITYSVPFSITAELTADSGGGQGLAIGALNLAIVVPHMIVSLGAGPWDALFGGGNIPAFILASFCALAAGVIATLRLPDLSSSFKSSVFHIG